jgi:hypothetical protein
MKESYAAGPTNHRGRDPDATASRPMRASQSHQPPYARTRFWEAATPGETVDTFLSDLRASA